MKTLKYTLLSSAIMLSISQPAQAALVAFDFTGLGGVAAASSGVRWGSFISGRISYDTSTAVNTVNGVYEFTPSYVNEFTVNVHTTQNSINYSLTAGAAPESTQEGVVSGSTPDMEIWISNTPGSSDALRYNAYNAQAINDYGEPRYTRFSLILGGVDVLNYYDLPDYVPNLSDFQNVELIAWSENPTTGYRSHLFTVQELAFTEVSAVPVPAAIWLFGSGLLGLAGVARRK